MIDEILQSYALTLDYLHRLIADIPDGELTRQPHGAVNHPAWIIGHLTCSCQAIGEELGLAHWLPLDWVNRFETGSTPIDDRSVYPSKQQLLTTLADGRRRLEQQLRAIGDAGMNAQLPDERYRDMFPTVGHAVIHILASHAAVHVGQLSVWRRTAGYAPLETVFV